MPGGHHRRRERAVADEALLKGLGAVVTQKRVSNSWTADRLATRSGLTGNTIAAIELGEQEPTWGNLRRLTKGLGIGLEELHEKAILLAPGPGGAELRRDCASAQRIKVSRLAREAAEDERQRTENERHPRKGSAESRAKLGGSNR